jgi:RNase P subunit RPR2
MVCEVTCEDCGHHLTVRHQFHDQEPVVFVCQDCGEAMRLTYLKDGWRDHPGAGMKVETSRKPAAAG